MPSDRIRHHSTGLLHQAATPVCTVRPGEIDREVACCGHHHQHLSGHQARRQSPMRLLPPARSFYAHRTSGYGSAVKLGAVRSSSQEKAGCLCQNNYSNNHLDADDEVDSDRARYTEQLRRVQYGRGPTSELLLGTALSRHPVSNSQPTTNSAVNSSVFSNAPGPGLVSSPRVKNLNRVACEKTPPISREMQGACVTGTVYPRTSSTDSVKQPVHSSGISHVFPNCIV